MTNQINQNENTGLYKPCSRYNFKINFTDNNKSFDSSGIQYIINPNDEFGLTKAVWMKETHKAEVVVASVGEVSCESTL